jgi:hypothetical protein
MKGVLAEDWGNNWIRYCFEHDNQSHINLMVCTAFSRNAQTLSTARIAAYAVHVRECVEV